MTWTYNGTALDHPPEDCLGFVYRITHKETGKQYIGKKLFWFSKTKQVKGKKKRFKVESDWKEYYGSNDALQADVLEQGVDNFTRDVLYLCKTKGEMSYLELREQMDARVLENTDKFYNSWIMCRVHAKHIKTLNQTV